MPIGHQNIVDFLKKSAEKKAISHAYLFSGPKSVGKSTVALEFAKTLLCRKASENERSASLAKRAEWFCGECESCLSVANGGHPDILIVRPDEEENIAVSKMRDLRAKLNLSPYSGIYQVAIIEEAEKMNKEAANTLLKTLEEPRGDKVVILISSEPKSILPTILSRVYNLKFNLVPADLIEKDIEKVVKSNLAAKLNLTLEKKKEIGRICGGRPGLALAYLLDEEKSRKRRERLEEFLKLVSSDNNERLRYVETLAKGEESIAEILGHWTDFLRDLMFLHLDFPEKIRNADFQKELAALKSKYPVEKTSRLLRFVSDVDFMVSRTNANPQLALETLVLAL